jgi:hypothetical protein
MSLNVFSEPFALLVLLTKYKREEAILTGWELTVPLKMAVAVSDILLLFYLSTNFSS